MGLVVVVLIVGVVAAIIVAVDSGKGLWGLVVWGSGGKLRATVYLSIVVIIVVWVLYIGLKGGGCKPHC